MSYVTKYGPRGHAYEHYTGKEPDPRTTAICLSTTLCYFSLIAASSAAILFYFKQWPIALAIGGTAVVLCCFSLDNGSKAVFYHCRDSKNSEYTQIP